MTLFDYRPYIKELERQVQVRIEMAIDRKYEYEGDDPVDSLPLTDYQRGLVAGRLETWEFFARLIPDTVKLVQRLHSDENKQKEDIPSTDPGSTD